MPAFNKYLDSAAVRNKFEDAVIIYVEGESDVEILSRLFPNLEGKLYFRLPIEGLVTGGCESVRKRVKNERSSNKKIYGILDRDFFFRYKKWEIFFEVNDVKYRLASKQDDGVWILSRWEIENYVLEYDALRALAKNWGRLKNEEEGVIASELLSICHKIMPLSAASALFHEYKTSLENGQYLCNERDAEGVVHKILERANKTLGSEVGIDSEFDNHYSCVRAFSLGNEADPQTEFESVIRIVDGKRFIGWLRHRFGIADDPTWQLAVNSSSRGPDSTDLHSFISEVLE